MDTALGRGRAPVGACAPGQPRRRPGRVTVRRKGKPSPFLVQMNGDADVRTAVSTYRGILFRVSFRIRQTPPAAGNCGRHGRAGADRVSLAPSLSLPLHQHLYSSL